MFVHHYIGRNPPRMNCKMFYPIKSNDENPRGFIPRGSSDDPQNRFDVLMRYRLFSPFTLRGQWCWCCHQKHRHLTPGHGIIRTEVSSSTASGNAVVRQSFDESTEGMTCRNIRISARADIRRIPKSRFNKYGHLAPGDGTHRDKTDWLRSPLSFHPLRVFR